MRCLTGLLPLAFFLGACSPTAPGDNPFAPVSVTPAKPPMAPGAESGTAAGAAAGAGAGTGAGTGAGAAVDDAFAEPEPVKLSSEQMASGTVAIATAAGVNVDALAGGKPSDAIPDAPPPAVGLPPQTRWPVRLVSTLPQAQPPRAILGLPSGKEIVVSPGSMLADEGLVVVAISNGQVELAQIEPAGDHAKITPIMLSSQYP